MAQLFGGAIQYYSRPTVETMLHQAWIAGCSEILSVAGLIPPLADVFIAGLNPKRCVQMHDESGSRQSGVGVHQWA